MDKKKFGSLSPGRLVLTLADDWAFVPHPLPPKWDFPTNLWPLLAQARAKMALLEGIGRTLPNPSVLLKPLARREAIQSSKIEGTYASAKDLFLFEMEGQRPKPGDNGVADWVEVLNYQRAIDHGINSSLPLSLRLIREMHSILLSGARGTNKAPGEFRRVPVAIGQDRRFIPPPPSEMNDCLHVLEPHLHARDWFVDALVESFLIHYQFETIHPFMDGNGRVGRLLLAVMIQQTCGLTKPWLYLSDVFEKHRDEYCQRLFDVSARAGWQGWIEFCLRATIDQAESTVRRCDRLRCIRETHLRKLAETRGNTRLNVLVESLFQSPFISVAEAARILNVTYPTAKSDLERLARAGILRELPNADVKTYFSSEIYEAAYGDLDQET